MSVAKGEEKARTELLNSNKAQNTHTNTFKNIDILQRYTKIF